MKRSKGMQLGALLAAMLLLGVTFVATVSAQGVNEERKVVSPDGRYIFNESDFDKAVISNGTITVPWTDDVNERHNISRNTIISLRKKFNVPENETVTLGCVKGNCTYEIVKPVKGTVITPGALSPLTPPPYSGWAEQATYLASSGTTSFNGNWQVPKGPSSWGGNTVLYYFIALEPPYSTDIIQPVLQWNFDGSNQWQIASWYCIGASCVHGNINPAYVNDYLGGYLEYEGNPAQWWIYTDDRTQQSEAVNNLADTRSWPYNFVTLETYNVNSCSNFPGGADFYGLGINNGIPGWNYNVNQSALNICSKLGVNIVSPHEVKLNTGN